MLKMNNFPGRSVLQKGDAPQGLFAFGAFGRHGVMNVKKKATP